MMSEYIPDYTDLFRQHDAEQTQKLDKLPVCADCDEPIQDEIYYEFDDQLICPHCLKKYHRKWTDNYIG
jgi:formylmethanofuran dehydrogenase subunit E